MPQDPKILGHYRIERTLGKGAMGVVYEGLDMRLHRKVAIKTIIKAGQGDTMAQEYSNRFLREAQAVARLNHPNIVHVYDFGEEDDVSFIVMEMINGTDLKTMIEAKEKFELKETLRLICELLDGLDFAHAAGVVHRDIKPANLMIDQQRRLKLTDFGVARLTDVERTRVELTQAGTMVGTPAYMSPEQVQGTPIDHRTDIFSTGVVLYQLLTGNKPFEGGAFTVAKRIVESEPPPPSAFERSISPELDRVVARALMKAPEARFSRAREFALALRRIFDKNAAAEADDEATVIASPQFTPSDSMSRGMESGTGSRSRGGGGHGAEADVEFWRTIKDSNEIEDLEFYVQKFPEGIYVDLAKRKIERLRKSGAAAQEDESGLRTAPRGRNLDEEFWRGVKDSDDADELELYLEKFPQGLYVDLARRRVARLRKTGLDDEATTRGRRNDEELWRGVRDSTDPADIEHYLEKFPQGLYVDLARRKIARLRPGAGAEDSSTALRRAEADAAAQREAEAKRVAEENARREAEARAQREAEAKRAAEEARLAEEQRVAEQKRIAEEKAKREAEEKAMREAEAKRVAEEQAKAKREAEERAKREAEEKKAAEERARRDAEERAKREAEAKAQREAEEKAKREAEERARREAEERARREAEEKALREAQAKAKREAEEKAKREAEEQEERARKAKAKLEAWEKSRQEADAKARREAEERAKREAEEAARQKAAAEKAAREADERARREAEESARQKAAAEKAAREAEEKAKREAKEQARREAEKREADEKARREAERLEKKAKREAESLALAAAPAATTKAAVSGPITPEPTVEPAGKSPVALIAGGLVALVAIGGAIAYFATRPAAPEAPAKVAPAPPADVAPKATPAPVAPVAEPKVEKAAPLPSAPVAAPTPPPEEKPVVRKVEERPKADDRQAAEAAKRANEEKARRELAEKAKREADEKARSEAAAAANAAAAKKAADDNAKLDELRRAEQAKLDEERRKLQDETKRLQEMRSRAEQEAKQRDADKKAESEKSKSRVFVPPTF